MDSRISDLALRQGEGIKYMKPVAQNATKETYVILSDDCDIIPETPVHNQKRFKRRKCKNSIKNSHETCINIDFDEKCIIQSAKTGSFNFNKPYIYHCLEEVLNYKENFVPKNNNIQLIGTITFNEKQRFYLLSIAKNLKIHLDFSITDKRPKEQDILSVFGSIEFNRNAPVFVVRFFRAEVEITVNKYIENLKRLRSFVPTEYFRIIQCRGSQLFK